MSRRSVEVLQEIVDRARDGIPGLVDEIVYRKVKNISFCFSLLSDCHKNIAMGKWYINGDYGEYRKHMYVAGRLDMESIRLCDFERMGAGSELFDALMSDSPQLIEAMARFEPDDYARYRHDPLNPEFFVHMWQLAILGDDYALAVKIHRLAKNGRKPWRKLCAEGRDFFSLLLCADKAGLESRILDDAKFSGDDPITCDFFHYLATFETKLCWYRGIEVNIDSPKVPMDLMPVKPLAYYDDVYEFLSPDWVPPRRGLLGVISRFFLK